MISKTTLSLLGSTYLFALNLFSNQNVNQILMAIWPALLMLAVFLVIGLLHRFVLKLFLSVNIIIASMTIFFKWQYGVTITEDILLSGLINDVSLTLEMVSVKFVVWVVITGLLPAVLIFFVRIARRSIVKQFADTIVLILLAAAGVLVVFYTQGYELRKKGQIRDPKFAQAIVNFSPLDIEYNFSKALKAKKFMKKMYSDVEVMSRKYHYEFEGDDLLIVLVFGESTRGDHFSINGYPKNTAPLLSGKDNLYSFSNVTSCDTITLSSIRCMASPMKRSDSGRKVTQSSFGEVLRSLGFKTEIYSLQTLNEFYHYFGYDKLISKYAILNEQESGARDVSLLPYAKEVIENYTSGKKLLILHTLGSHQTYCDRLTAGQEVFKPACQVANVSQCSKEELTNAYDNTILAIDSFLSTLIDELSDKKAILVYVSDHGESLGENGNYFHGKPLDIAPKEQFSVPLIVWFSQKYADTEEGKKRLELLKALPVDTPLSHDNLFHSILGCAGVKSSDGGIDQKLDICSQR